MQKRLLPFYLAASLVSTPSTAVQAPEPFIELEAMKMFCTVQLDMSQSDETIVQELSSWFSMPWSVRLHPQAAPNLQDRFQHIMQQVANELGQDVGGFAPGIYPPVKRPFIEEDPRPESVYISYEIQRSFLPNLRDEAAEENFIDQSNIQPPSSGGGPGQGTLRGSAFLPRGFSYENFKSSTVLATSKILFEKLIYSLKDPVYKVSHLIKEENMSRAARKMPSALPKIVILFDRPESLKKSHHLLGWLHCVALKNWVKAEVITPLIAAILLLLTPLCGDVFGSTSPIFLRRRRFS